MNLPIIFCLKRSYESGIAVVLWFRRLVNTAPSVIVIFFTNMSLILLGRLLNCNLMNVLGFTRSLRKLFTVLCTRRSVLFPISGISGDVVALTSSSFCILSLRLNHASPVAGMLNRLLKFDSSCSSLFSRYKNDGIRTVVYVSSVSIILTRTSVDDVCKL